MLAIYTRLSKEDSDSTSIKNQLREGEQFAKDNNFKNIEIYDEGEGISGGADIKDRPQLFKLLQDFRANKIKAVWFRNQNRLERNSSTYAIFISEAQKYKVDVYFNDKLLDFDNPSDNLLGTITSAVNQYQKDLQAVQTKRSLIDNVREGKVWSVVAYGYKSDNGYLAIDEQEFKIIKEIYELSLSGLGTNTIANRLNERNVPTRKNKLFRAKTIQGIIKNPIYKGQRNYSNQTFDSPIIIEPLFWQKVNDNLVKNRNNSGKKVDHKYLLKGLIKCVKCGRNYYGRRRANLKDNFYSCVGKRYKEIKCTNRSINITVLENFIWQRFFLDKRLKKITLKHFENNDFKLKSEVLVKEVDNLKEKLKSLSEQRKKATKLIVQGLFSDKDFEREINRIESEKSDTDIRIKNYLEDLDSYNKSVEKEKEIDKDLKSLKDFSFNQKGSLIKKYINKIEVDFINNFYHLEVSFNIIDMPNEKYIIDRTYNFVYDKEFFVNGRVIILKDKLKSLSENELKHKIIEFEEKYNPQKELMNEVFLEEINSKEYQEGYNQILNNSFE